MKEAKAGKNNQVIMDYSPLIIFFMRFNKFYLGTGAGISLLAFK